MGWWLVRVGRWMGDGWVGRPSRKDGGGVSGGDRRSMRSGEEITGGMVGLSEALGPSSPAIAMSLSYASGIGEWFARELCGVVS